jgi:hypothetical protein
MAILALYVPNTTSLPISMALLAILFVVCCVIARRMNFSVVLAAVLMAVGCGMALGPGIHLALNEDLGAVGDVARQWSHSDHSDAFFAVTAYMHIGGGTQMGFAGMAIPLVAYAAVAALVERFRRAQPTPDGIADTVSPTG